MGMEKHTRMVGIKRFPNSPRSWLSEAKPSLKHLSEPLCLRQPIAPAFFMPFFQFHIFSLPQSPLSFRLSEQSGHHHLKWNRFRIGRDARRKAWKGRPGFVSERTLDNILVIVVLKSSWALFVNISARNHNSYYHV